MADTFALGDNTYRPMVDGPWAGDDARDVLELAIRWWEQELALIDEQVSRCKGNAQRQQSGQTKPPSTR
jgi:hypothetical protein